MFLIVPIIQLVHPHHQETEAVVLRAQPEEKYHIELPPISFRTHG